MLRKIAWGTAADVAGLGVLATPSIATLADKKATKKEKRHAAFETVGLGAIAAHPVHTLVQAAKKGGWQAMKHASIHPSSIVAFADELEKIAGGFDRARLWNTKSLAKGLQAIAKPAAPKPSGALTSQKQLLEHFGRKQQGALFGKGLEKKSALFSGNPFAFGQTAKKGAQVFSSLAKSTKAAPVKAAPLQKNISNFTPKTQTGKGWGAQRTWENNPNAIELK